MLQRCRCLLLFTLFVFCSSLMAQEIHTEHDVFYAPGTGTYVEVNMLLVDWQDSALTRSAQVLTLVQQDTAIIDFRKTELQLDPGPNDVPRIHSERLATPPGEYDLKVEVTGLYQGRESKMSAERSIRITPIGDQLQFSDILLAEQVTIATTENNSRNGYHLVPYVSTYYHSGLDELNFYAEIYKAAKHLGQDTPYLVTYEIQEHETGQIHGQFKSHKRLNAKPLDAIIATFDITDLPSGNYKVVLQALDREGNPLARREQFFQRSKPVLDTTLSNVPLTQVPPDTLVEYLNSLLPIAQELEAKMIRDLQDDEPLRPDQMRSMFTKFWEDRDPDDPFRSWDRYHAEVIKVNKLYGTRVKEGYQTDRGAVHLKYGAPNTITDRANDMNAYPYQIWHYYKAGRYNNKRFIFYLPDLVTNDYVLLHSEVPGEVMDPRWNQTIHSRNNARNDVIGQDPNSQSSDNAREWFETPR